MKRLTLSTAFAAMVLAAAPVGISAPTAAAQTTIDGPRLAAILQTLDQQPDTFGGYTIDRDSRTVTVRVADMQHWSPGDFLASLNPDTAVDYADSPDLNGSWALTFSPARASVATLAALAADLPTTEPFATAAADGTLASWGVDPDADRVSVGLTVVDAQFAQQVAVKFGDLVELHQEDRPVRTSRVSDTAPFWSGDKIWINGGYCTSGFRITMNSTKYMLTDGHCSPGTGYTVYTGGNTWATANTPMGTIDYRNRGQNGWDTALIGGKSYGLYAWIGDLTSTSSVSIGGHANPVNSQWVCSDGSTSFRNCNYQTGSGTSDCVTFNDGVTTCHLTTAIAKNGATGPCPGDSGGPVMTSGNPTTAIGIVIGTSASCSVGARMYYHAIGPLLSHWNASFG